MNDQEKSSLKMLLHAVNALSSSSYAAKQAAHIVYESFIGGGIAAAHADYIASYGAACQLLDVYDRAYNRFRELHFQSEAYKNVVVEIRQADSRTEVADILSLTLKENR